MTNNSNQFSPFPIINTGASSTFPKLFNPDHKKDLEFKEPMVKMENTIKN